MLKGVITIMLLLLGSRSSLACFGGQGGERPSLYDWDGDTTKKPGPGPGPDESVEEKQNVSHIKDVIDRNKKIVWEGWTPPPEVEQNWRDWLVTYNLKTNKSGDLNPELEKEREEEGNWLPGWAGLGEGLTGYDPPPWAFVPKYTGKPDACRHAPRYGRCAGKQTRWAWNAFLDKCMSYTWSGCGGSKNNFQTKLECEDACEVSPAPICDSDSLIPIEVEDE